MPSHHSHSSHSSFSHSSFSSGSSFSSSSSRSSFHSSSPSHHSSSSHSSSTRHNSSYRAPSRSVRPKLNPSVVERPRFNQPKGFEQHHSFRPTMFYCVHHNYLYYPEAWEDNGIRHESGYYDEDGRYYKELNAKSSFADGIVCQCPYCNTTKIVKWSEATEISLECENCGGQMEIVNSLDRVIDSSEYDASYASRINTDDEQYKTVRKICSVLGDFSEIFIAICTFFFSISMITVAMKAHPFHDVQQISQQPAIAETQYQNPTDTHEETISNTDYFGTTIYLSQKSDGVFSIADKNDYTKTLIYDSYEDSYYDESMPDYWLWYNTDVFPHIWQYWYEPIANDYPDYGWMEWDSQESKWYIEISDGNWQPVPETYDTSMLWHIEQGE